MSFVGNRRVWKILDLITSHCSEISPTLLEVSSFTTLVSVRHSQKFFRGAWKNVLMHYASCYQNQKLIVLIILTLPLNKVYDNFSTNATSIKFWIRTRYGYPLSLTWDKFLRLFYLIKLPSKLPMYGETCQKMPKQQCWVPNNTINLPKVCLHFIHLHNCIGYP